MERTGKINALEYDAVIVDLDFTIWHGSKPRLWSKALKDYKALQSEDGITHYIVDSSGEYIKIDNCFRTFAKELHKNNISLGFCTRGGLLDVTDSEQPPLICLKMFDIYDEFDGDKIVLYKTENKGKSLETSIARKNKILFIDDTDQDLEDVKLANSALQGNTDVYNRNNFTSWLELL